MTKREFVKRLNRKIPGRTAMEINSMLCTMFKEIERGLLSKKRVQLRGLGTLYVKFYASRQGVDPRNGRKFEVMPSCRPVFTPSNKLLRIEGKE